MLRWLHAIRLLRLLIIAGALIVVTSAYMLLAGQWVQWLGSVVAAVACVAAWRRLRARRQRPALVIRMPP